MNNFPRITHLVKWRQLTDFPNYYVSNNGLVRYKNELMTLKLRPGWKTYYFVGVRNTDTGRYARFWVYRLVWDYFGDKPFVKGCEVHHKDENANNNHIDNLELLPMKEHRKIHAKSHCKGYVRAYLRNAENENV